MKITSVDVFKLNIGTNLEGHVWAPICVRINTDEGISGFGEAGLAYGNAHNAAFGICQDFAKLIIGMDPFKIEAIWEKLFRMTFWGMGGGTVIFSGFSAIDIALWDIKGKAMNTPVYNLLGGKTNDSLRAYASQLQIGWGKNAHSAVLVDPKEYYDVTKVAMADGYDCIKVDPVYFTKDGKPTNRYGLFEYDDLKLAVDRIAAMREAGGDALDIIIEVHSLTDTNTAIQLGRELEQFRCFYYEEPVHPLNSQSMREIAENVKIPIATGERSYGRWGYREMFEKRALQIIQPDLCNTGGITEGKKICDMANVYDMGVQIHICGSPISTAAALQLEAVIPNFVIHEHHSNALLPMNTESCIYDYQPVNGYYSIPDKPGIGQELTEKTMAEADHIVIK